MARHVELMRIDEDYQEPIKFAAGTHVLGRGPALKCTETKISRNQALLEISDEDQVVAITAIHANPCFFQAVDCDDEEFSILRKGDRKILSNGDKISLLPASWTYKLIIKLNTENEINSDELNKAEENEEFLNRSNSNSRKRILPVWLQKLGTGEATSDPEPKKQRSSSKKETDVKLRGNYENTTKQKRTYSAKAAKEAPSNNAKAAKEVPSNSAKSAKEAPSNSAKVSIAELSNSETEDEAQCEEEKNDTTVNKENQNIQTTNPQTVKRHCLYGSKCYRKNSQHFEEFSHSDNDKASNEDDKDSDEDDRPECEYGLNCYRKNPQHLKDFKHVRQKRDAAKKARATTRMINDDESSNDSFIVDDEDDDPEYAASDSETDDEYSGLMDEANSFIKGTKK